MVAEPPTPIETQFTAESRAFVPARTDYGFSGGSALEVWCCSNVLASHCLTPPFELAVIWKRCGCWWRDWCTRDGGWCGGWRWGWRSGWRWGWQRCRVRFYPAHCLFTRYGCPGCFIDACFVDYTIKGPGLLPSFYFHCRQLERLALRVLQSGALCCAFANSIDFGCSGILLHWVVKTS